MSSLDLLHADLTHAIIGAFYAVYNTLGFGFLERIYMNALERELIAKGHRVDRETFVNIWYKGECIGRQRLDMVVDDTVVVESKSTYDLRPNATRQLKNYLCASKYEVGLLLHFGPKPKFFREYCHHARATA